MIIIATPTLIAILGLLAYALSQNGKIQELGRLAFAVALLAALLLFGGFGTRLH